MRSEIQITFLGGASAIGASCTLVQVDNVAVLVDCGIRLQSDAPLPDLDQLSGQRLDAIVVTHAHADHTGALPVVCDAFPDAPVYAAPPTLDLCNVLFGDALKLMDQAQERDSELPLYTARQVERFGESAVPVHYHESVSVGPVKLTFLPAGHILGAAMVHLATPAGHVLFTGDYSISAQRAVPALSRPEVDVDLVVSESTYGTRLHEDRRAAEERLVNRIHEILVQGGRVLVPAFAIGRAQEVLLILKAGMRNGGLPKVPVLVDGMVRSVCDIYGRHDRYVTRALLHEIRRAPHAFYTDEIRPVRSAQERAKTLAAGPCVVVASSGMLSGGASVYYAQALAANPQDAILLTGYQDEESPGRALLRLAGGDPGGSAPSQDVQKPREVRLAGKVIDVRCQVDKYALSAHADRMQMAGLIEALRPRTVALVHGDAAAKHDLQQSLGCRDTVIASDGLRLARGYPLKARPTAAVPAGQLDRHAARRLLGPAQSVPLRSEGVAEAFFGGPVPRADRERLIDRLEGLGLVRRDDQHRAKVWVLGPEDTAAFADETALAQELKEENPKGRLFELCMRAGVSPPELEELGVEGHEYLARMTLTIDNRDFDSGVQRAPCKRMTEQLAARELLAAVRDAEAVAYELGGCVDEPQQAAALKNSNPKGRLLELCLRKQLSRPAFETRASVGGMFARVSCRLSDGRTTATAWFCARDTKTAEQAAAHALLQSLDAADTSADSGAEAPPTALIERRPALNEMRQLGVLTDFGYDVTEVRGPAHQRIFVMRGWAQVPSGERVRTGDIAEASKKKAERCVAAALYEVLAERGFA